MVIIRTSAVEVRIQAVFAPLKPSSANAFWLSNRPSMGKTVFANFIALS